MHLPEMQDIPGWRAPLIQSVNTAHDWAKVHRSSQYGPMVRGGGRGESVKPIVRIRASRG